MFQHNQCQIRRHVLGPLVVCTACTFSHSELRRLTQFEIRLHIYHIQCLLLHYDLTLPNLTPSMWQQQACNTPPFCSYLLLTAYGAPHTPSSRRLSLRSVPSEKIQHSSDQCVPTVAKTHIFMNIFKIVPWLPQTPDKASCLTSTSSTFIRETTDCLALRLRGNFSAKFSCGKAFNGSLRPRRSSNTNIHC